MRSLLFIFAVACIATHTSGQYIQRPAADSLLKLLPDKAPGIERIDILLSLAQFHIFKPGENQVDFDSAGKYIEEAKKINKTVSTPASNGYLLLTESYMLEEMGQKDVSKKMAENAVTLLEKGDNVYYQGKGYYELSRYFGLEDKENILPRIELVKKAVAAFHKSGHLEEEAFSLTMLGDLYNIGNDLSNAREALRLALSVYNSIGYIRLQRVYAELGKIYIKTNDYKHGLQYQLQALKTAEADLDSSMQMASIYNNLGTIYRETGQKDIAINYYKNMLKIVAQLDDKRSTILSVYHTVLCYLDLQQPLAALHFLDSLPKRLLEPRDEYETSLIAMAYMGPYLQTKNFAEATDHYHTLSKLMEDPEVPAEIANSIYIAMTAYHLALKQYDKARFYLERNLQISQPLPGSRRLWNISRLWYKVDSATANYRGAFNHLHRYKTISDSLFNESKAKQFQTLEVQYETAKKEDSIKLKNQDIAHLQQENKLQQANLNLTVAVIGIAVAIIGLLFWQYRHKQQNNKIITIKNYQLERLILEKEWLVKEVHHRVKNNLQTIVSLLELQPGSLGQEAVAAITDSRNRVFAMSLIHQKLYHSDNITSVNMPAYITELVNYLREVYHKTDRVSFNIRVSPVELDVSQAVPIGLIVNEAVTNSLKYAFSAQSLQPKVDLLLHEEMDGRLTLLIQDNGIGLIESDKFNQKDGFGLKLIKGLAEDINGKLNVLKVNGVSISITFDPNISFLQFRNNAVVKNDVTI